MRTRLLLSIALTTTFAAGQNGGIPAPGNVSLPLEQYNRLLELAAKAPRQPEPPPVPYALRSARINWSVDGAVVAGSVALDGETFTTGAAKVPLLTGMTVTSGQMKGKDLPLTREAGAHVAVLSGPAEFAVTLETVESLTLETGRASFHFVTPPAASVRFTLSVPGHATDVNLSPGLITSRVSNGGRTVVEATLAPGQATTLSWASRLPAPPPSAPKETRFLSDVKTLVSLTESELISTTLADVTVVQGEPAEFRAALPAGFQFSSATGPTLVSHDTIGGELVLRATASTTRAHQFLITLTRPATGAESDVPMLAFTGAQRETGEVLVEAEGSIELTATGKGALRRMDLKETSAPLRAMARGSLQAAYRYQKRAADTPLLALKWTRFPDAPVLPAAAQNAVVTTLVTSEGRTLTEIKLTVKNQAQPFLKVELPAGATILSADVAGEKVKPVEGPDGSRVPLLRPGFRPPESYAASFVVLQSGNPFDKKGAAQLELPKMDVPVGVVEWEVFLPQQYRVTGFGGDVVRAALLREYAVEPSMSTEASTPGQLGGTVLDQSGAAVPKARITIAHIATGLSWTETSDRNGRWRIGNLQGGRMRVTIGMQGFKSYVQTLDYDSARGYSFTAVLEVGNVTESVQVTAGAPAIGSSASVAAMPQSPQVERNTRQNAAMADSQVASRNVMELQKRVVGVLPIPINVPKAGNAYRFVRALVVEEVTRLTFNYRRL